MSFSLSQFEADYLIKLLKRCVDFAMFLPLQGESEEYKVTDVASNSEDFIVLINRRNKFNNKCSFVLRYKKANKILLRLDVGCTSKHTNERFCKTLNKLNRANVVNTLFGWQETREQRKGSCDLIVFTNEVVKSSDTYIRGLGEYGIDTIPKSEIGKEACNKHFLIAG